MSRAHTLAEIGTKEQLGELEAANRALHREIESLRRHQAQHLARLRSAVAEQREALSALEQALDAAEGASGSDGPAAAD